jgi:hypothetical protein
MMRTLLFATAAITLLAVAAPAFARGHFRGEYGNGYVMRHRVPRAVDLDAEGYHGYVPNNWASYCNQLPKAC